MGAVYFYHLTERRLDAVLPPLLDKARAALGRVVVRGPDRAMLERLDVALWQGDGFLPHGLDGGPHYASQPVLLTDSRDTTAPCLMSVGGAEITATEVEAASRACILFDGLDEAAVIAARKQWKTLTGAGVEAQYWADEGGWVKKAESRGSTT